MADPKEPKKETVRITLPPGAGQPPATPAPEPDTVRINLPTRPPPQPPSGPASTPPRPPLAQTPLPPPPAKRVDPPPLSRPPPGPLAGSGLASGGVPAPPPMPAPPTGPAAETVASSPKKETARIAGLPTVASKAPTVEMKKTQPLVTMPAARKATAPLSVTPTTAEPIANDVSMGLCWALLGVSAVILIIQIWNYFV
jgi:hypothetical protein